MIENQPTARSNPITRQLLPDKQGLSDPAVLRDYFRNSPVTFWGEGLRKEDLIMARFPDQKQLLAMADATVDGKLRFWQPWHMEQTSTFENIETPINWQAVPNGDLEWTHALLRLYHFLDLAIAFNYTQKQKYLHTIENHLRSFTIARFERRGIISDNLLDAAMRINHLVRSFDLIKQTQWFSPKGTAQIITILIEESNILVSRLRVKAGNWEFFITIAVLISALYLREICDVSQWQKEGEKRLREIIDSEILQDGNLIEACPMYHGQCLLLLLDYMLMLKNNRMAPPAYLENIIENMMAAVQCVANPQGKIPRLGDSDVLEIEYIRHFASCVTGNKYEASDKLSSDISIDDMKASGWLIYRFPLNRATGYFLFDISGKPPPGRAWHSHADDLQFLFHDGENEVFIDPGRFTYSSYFKRPLPFVGMDYKPVGLVGFLYHLRYPQFREMNKRDWRAHFRHTLSHNTVCCDGKMQPGYTNLKEYPTVVDRLFHFQEGPLFYSGGILQNNTSWLTTHIRHDDSLRKESDIYEHKRTIFGFIPYCFVITDTVTADKPHQWISSYHVAPHIVIKRFRDNLYQLTTRSELTHYLQLHSNRQTDMRTTINPDWSSLSYNQREQSTIIRMHVINQQSASMVSIILPTANLPHQYYSSKVDYFQMAPNQPLIVSIKLGNKEINIYFSNVPGKLQQWDQVSSDSALALTSYEDNQLAAVGFILGSQIKVGDQRFSTSHPNTNLFQRLR
ncbi:MAG TPA: alginate lyase family protein [candidate division Zixibacteria bacterium]|nr:alginate lyase family protein [candidate division Zixibacteria bacterium]